LLHPFLSIHANQPYLNVFQEYQQSMMEDCLFLSLLFNLDLGFR
jgi:hypothetical protein